MSLSVHTNESIALPHRRWRTWWLALPALLILGVFHAPLLRAVQHGLIFDQTVGMTDYTVVMFGDKASLDMAQKRLGTTFNKTSDYFGNAYTTHRELGLAPRLGDVATQELVNAGLLPEVIATHTTHTNTTHAAFRKLVAELPDDATVAVLCPHDRSRYLHMVITAALEPVVQSRWSFVRFLCMATKNRNGGVIAKGGNVFPQLGCVNFILFVCGEPPALQAWNPDDYERSLAW